MKFYIMANQQADCKKRLEKMFAKLANKPSVTFGEVEQKVKKRITDLKDGDGVDRFEEKQIVDVVLVEIEDFAIREWRLVASVYFYEGIVAMCDDNLFKDMPKQFGLDYFKCDFCGSTRSHRKESHVLYNKITGEWKQVGSECVNKVIDGAKYLSKLIVQLNEYFLVTLCGCEYGEVDGWKIPDHSWQQALDIKTAIALCKAYRTNKTTAWVKSEYTDYGKVGGTNDDLQRYYGECITNGLLVDDEDLFNNVANYVSGLNGGLDWDGSPDFNQRIKDAFSAEYIRMGDVYLAYFALKGYEDGIGQNAFLNKCTALGIEKDAKYNFVGVLDSYKIVQGYYGSEIICKFTADNGMRFEKTLTNLNTLAKFTKEQIADEYGFVENKFFIGKHYSFSCNVKYIKTAKEVVGLGGRMAKVK